MLSSFCHSIRFMKEHKAERDTGNFSIRLPKFICGGAVFNHIYFHYLLLTCSAQLLTSSSPPRVKAKDTHTYTHKVTTRDP